MQRVEQWLFATRGLRQAARSAPLLACGAHDVDYVSTRRKKQTRSDLVYIYTRRIIGAAADGAIASHRGICRVYIQMRTICAYYRMYYCPGIMM